MPVLQAIRTLPRAFFSPRGLVLTVLLGMVLALPSLRVGFYLDDYAQLALLESWYPENADLFNLYSFLGTLPLDPWWKHPDFTVSMWRPLSSALLHLDNRLFGHQALGYHAHSILWFTGILAAIGLLFSKALSPRLAVLALLIFALDECHILNVGWIANRHAMVAMLPSLLGLYAHLRWREDDWGPGLPVSVLGYVLGLFGGEVALGVMAYAVAYELFAGPGGKARQRLLGLAPVFLVAGTYALWYKLMGFGAAHSGFYLDPTGEVHEFTRAAASHLPALLAGILLGLPSDLWFFAPDARPFQIVAGSVACLVFAWLLVSAWKDLDTAERRALRWLLPGAGFALLPAAVAQPFDRVLIAPMIGGAALIAVVLHHNWRRSRQRPAENRIGKVLAVCLALLLVGLHLILPPLNRLATYRFMEREWFRLEQLATRIPIDPPSTGARDVVLLTAPDIVIGGFLPLVYGFQGNPMFRSWSVLSLAPYDHVITRSGSRTLELSVVGGQMLASPPERFHRSSSDMMERGDVVETAAFEVEILETNALGPTRVAFRFKRELEDPSLRFLRWGDGVLQAVALPPVGESITVPLMRGPMVAALEDLWSF